MSTKGFDIMSKTSIHQPLQTALRFYAFLFAAIVVFQGTGLVMYLINVWPTYRAQVSTGAAMLLVAAVVMGFARSFVWISIYWTGSKALSLLRGGADSPECAQRLTPVLASLTWLLVTSCILDVLFLPAYFLSDVVLPFPLAGWRLGVVEVARLLFPQAFGIAALILAFLTHQYGQLFKERSELQNELDLTI